MTAVPRFIVIQRDGELITARGRKEVQDKGVICFRNWHQAALVHEGKLAQQQATSAGNQDSSTEGQPGVSSAEKPDNTAEINDKK